MASIDPRQRLLELAEARHASLAQLSALIGRNASYLQQFVRKGSPRKLEENDRRTLARFFGVTEAELGGTEEISYGLPGGPRRQEPRRQDWADVPRLALGASAGPGALAGGEDAVGTLRFSTQWLRGMGLDPARLSVLSVAGDSMEPTLRDGDEILVDRSPRPWRDGIHVVRIDDVLLVKRLESAGPGRVRVLSDNPAYPRFERPLAEVAIIGRVVWKGGRI